MSLGGRQVSSSVTPIYTSRSRGVAIIGKFSYGNRVLATASENISVADREIRHSRGVLSQSNFCNAFRVR